MGQQLCLFPQTAGSQTQSVSNGAVSHGSETEQQRQRQYDVRMREFLKSYEESPSPWLEVDEVKKKKTNRSTQKSKPNHYGTKKKQV